MYLKRAKEKDTFVVTSESKDAPEMEEFTVTLQDQENGGMVLELGEIEPVDTRSKADVDVIDAVQGITDRGIGATARGVAEALGKDSTTVQKRLTKLVTAGYLAAMPISDVSNPTILYSVVSR